MFFLISDASSPAASAPVNAATAAGIPVKSTRDNRRVLATAPIIAAVEAMGIELLNIIENPRTPQKLAHRRKISLDAVPRCTAIKSSGCNFRIIAVIQAPMVATSMMINA